MSGSDMLSPRAIGAWHKKWLPQLEELAEELQRELEAALAQAVAAKEIPDQEYSVAARAKDTASLQRKLSRKWADELKRDDYAVTRAEDLPDKVSDLIGLRLIVPLEADRRPDSIQLRWLETVFLQGAVGPFEIRGQRDVGAYSGAHLDYSLPSDRLPDGWPAGQSLTIEIQVRSILEHAFAAIQHDFVYKSSVALSKEDGLERAYELTLVSAALQIADQRFTDMAQKYTRRGRVKDPGVQERCLEFANHFAADRYDGGAAVDTRQDVRDELGIEWIWVKKNAQSVSFGSGPRDEAHRLLWFEGSGSGTWPTKFGHLTGGRGNQSGCPLMTSVPDLQTYSDDPGEMARAVEGLLRGNLEEAGSLCGCDPTYASPGGPNAGGQDPED